jgi:hypothetical protein
MVQVVKEDAAAMGIVAAHYRSNIGRFDIVAGIELSILDR